MCIRNWETVIPNSTGTTMLSLRILRQKDAGSDTPELENSLARAYQAKGMTKQAQDAKERALQLRGGAH